MTGAGLQDPNAESATRYVALVSSVHQIELSALVMLKASRLLRQSDRILVFIEDDLDSPTSVAIQLKAPRLTFPTPLMVLEGGRTYRQLFGPAVIGESEFNLESLNVSLDLWRRALRGRLDEVLLKEIKKRGDSLLESVKSVAADPAALTAAVIEHILRSALGRPIEVRSYSAFVASIEGQEYVYRALLSVCREVLLESGPATFRFRKGGHVLLTNDSGAQVARFDTAHVTSSEAVLVAKDVDAFLVLPLDRPTPVLWRHGVATEINGGSRFALRGPLLMALLSQVGVPIDVPWYYEAVDRDPTGSRAAACFGLELISPVSVASPERTSRWAGGQGLRLDPTGYSLLEFDHPSARALASAIARVDSDRHYPFHDWRHLISHYPSRKQKALKDQGGVALYCQRRLQDIRQSLKSGSPGVIEQLGQGLRELCPTEYGRIGLQLMALRKYTADSRATTKVQLSAAQWNALRSIGAVAGREIDEASLARWMLLLRDSMARWRESVAKDDSLHELSNREEALQRLRSLSEFATSPPPLTSTSQSQYGDRDVPLPRTLFWDFQGELFMYYRAALAISATLLKSQLFTTWLLLGQDGFINTGDMIIKARTEYKDLWLRSRLWKLLA